MPASQQIFRVRRKYNQWVANQTLEDYALRFTAKKSRYWSAEKVAMTALGATAFLALEALGGAITLSYGFTNAVAAILVVCALIFIIGFPISYYASRYGVDIDLLTRGAGFGYLGSTLTSLIYASFTFIFFAIEAAILSSALEALFNIPLFIGYIISSVIVIPIVTHGITFISRFQIGTQPIWLTLQIVAIVAIGINEISAVDDWMQFAGIQAGQSGIPTADFDILLFGSASAILFALIAQNGEQVDYLRFLPPKNKVSSIKWWSSMILAGPGWVFIGVIKLLIGSFLAYIAFSDGLSLEKSADPIHMYQIAFNYMTHSPGASLWLAGVMVIISQMKINVTNAYAGSIAWSNFFSRLTHSHPGRVVWLVFNVAIALLLMELGIYRALESILGMFALVAVSWLGSIAADLVINKTIGLSPPGIEFKRAHLYDINPVGVGSLFITSAIGIIAYLGLLGETAKALAHFITLASTFVFVPLIAFITKGKYYIARESNEIDYQQEEHQCCICENNYESEDISFCPAYQGPICSLCCTLDARCLDSCKTNARYSEQISDFFSGFLPKKIVNALNSRLSHFLSILFLISLFNGGLLSLIYYQFPSSDPQTLLLLFDALWILFFILLIISGILAWLFLLAHESRLVAQQESQRQTARLISEIDAHTQTDHALQEAMEIAEAASQAKTRYLSGISHELRTPLQSIIGYAQLLSQDPSIPEKRRDSINIIQRSGDYLADLIEGLLDISKIEAGKLEIRRDEMNFHELVAQLELMFRPQAEAKGLQFNFSSPKTLPHYVVADEQRVRQILINVLSNAIKYTEQGEVSFALRYRNQVAEFIVEDTGSGISNEDLERIFKPFERVGQTNVSGTGLGLTIVHLLADIMGGDVSVTSHLGKGSTFAVSLMLSSIDSVVTTPAIQSPIIAYDGGAKTIFVVDDQAMHRSLMNDLLTPLGFIIVEAPNAKTCLQLTEEKLPDIFLLDVSMPDMDGLTLAQNLRDKGIKQPIIMISADAQEHHRVNDPNSPHDRYMVKPIKIQSLLDHLASLLTLSWRYAEGVENNKTKAQKAFHDASNRQWSIPQHESISELISYARIGYSKGFTDLLEEMEDNNIIDSGLIQHLYQLAKNVRFDKIVTLLEVSNE
ncbi:MAG: signal transduction histidine kinase/FixJ family two-component response regulator [Kiritimatiellia bacterium]|jgi:signal transduction histidine kinase/FixJ family two-component response regulator